MKKIILVAGARPNFMKVAPLYREMNRYSEYFDAVLVHTGQHYDSNMSDTFFSDLELPAPDVYLGIGSGSHAEQTAGVMTGFEKVCLAESPDFVIVVGDVNSTMACAITAAKANIAVGHVEAGLRSYDRTMPEEINRLVTDCISDLLFTPSSDADANLLREGISSDKIYRVGNIMIDSLEFILPKVNGADTCSRFGLVPKDYGLITLHRPSNVDIREVLKQIVDILIKTAETVKIAFPVHPRTRKNLEKFGILSLLENAKNIILLEPLGYLDFMNLLVNTKFVLTDSGGLQEETTYLGIPCLTLRPNTERPVTINEGTNELVTIKDLYHRISDAYNGKWKKGKIPELWDGKTASRIAEIIKKL